MKKFLLATAISAAIAAPAMAQNVMLMGRASMEVGQWQSVGATAGSAADFRARTRVADTSSRFAFAVSEDLGGGLSAGIYCETGINIDSASNTNQQGTVNRDTSEWCSREGHARLGNQTAEVRLGRQNVWWTQGQLNNLAATYFGVDTGTHLQFLGSTVYGVRLENMVKVVAGRNMGPWAGSDVYWGVMGNSGAQERAPAANTSGEAAGAGASPAGKYQGFKVQYNQGEILGMIDHQRSTGDRSAGINIDRNAYKYGLGYRFAGVSSASIISAQFWNKSATVAALGGKIEDNGWLVTLQYDLGGGRILHGNYGAAADQKLAGQTRANTGATGYTVGVTQAMSKRTHLYAVVHSIKNESQPGFLVPAYTLLGAGYQSGTSAAGSDPRAWGVGMIHNF